MGDGSMNPLRRIVGPMPLGIWFAFAALGVLCVAWAMQAFSLIAWDTAVDMGLQNERFDGDAGERAWALESWGVAMADMIWALPITLVGLVGLVRRRWYGLMAAVLSLSIGVYFPLVFSFQRWSSFRGTAVVALCMFALPCLAGILGLGANRRFFG